MSPIGNMIIIGMITLGASIGVVAAIKHFGKPRPMKIVPPEERAEEALGDGAWVITSGKFPKSGVLREHEPRGMGGGSSEPAECRFAAALRQA